MPLNHGALPSKMYIMSDRYVGSILSGDFEGNVRHDCYFMQYCLLLLMSRSGLCELK